LYASFLKLYRNLPIINLLRIVSSNCSLRPSTALSKNGASPDWLADLGASFHHFQTQAQLKLRWLNERKILDATTCRSGGDLRALRY